MSGAAQKEEILGELPYEAAVTGTESAAALKQIASERLLAHRQRRAAGEGRRSTDTVEAAPRVRGASRVREAVEARYKDSVTYREFLAQEAERALEQAQAEAEVAALKAQAVAAAQMRLLEELKEWEMPAPSPREIAIAERKAEMRDTLAHAMADIAVAATDVMEKHPLAGMPPVGEAVMRAHMQERPATEVAAAGLTVRLYEDLSAARPLVEGARRVEQGVEQDEHEATALDAEIAFRRDPEFEHYVPQQVGISGNLIEFPRQLVAARKVRPRLAEGPLREETAPEPQLRIFEVEPEQVSAAPVEVAGAPEWQSILLEGAQPAKPVVHHVEEQFHYTMQPQTARAELRLMAAMVDTCCVAAGLLGFATVVAEIAGPSLWAMPLPLLGASVAGVAAILYVMYELLFFTLGEATPGMRYAKIALCTFADGNPTRSAMRRRVLATVLAACPLGLGLAWAWMDEDGLGWHDRISRMYQRAY